MQSVYFNQNVAVFPNLPVLISSLNLMYLSIKSIHSELLFLFMNCSFVGDSAKQVISSNFVTAPLIEAFPAFVEAVHHHSFKGIGHSLMNRHCTVVMSEFI